MKNKLSFIYKIKIRKQYRDKKRRRKFLSAQMLIGLMIVLFFLFICLFAPLLAPNDPLSVNVADAFLPPCRAYPLGTDNLGRCLLSRLIWGSRISMGYSAVVLTIMLLVGVFTGLLSGYVGGLADSLIMRLTDIFMAMPSILVVMAIAGTLGRTGANLVLAMSLVYWAGYARITRALTLSVRESSFILALRAGGTCGLRLLFKHILRNICPTILSLATMEFGSIILAIAGFSFLGIGVQAPLPEWGVMLSDSRNYIQSCPRLMILPGLTIVTAVLGFNFLGDGFKHGLEQRK